MTSSRKRNRNGGQRGRGSDGIPPLPPGFWTPLSHPGNPYDVSTAAPQGVVHNLDLRGIRQHQHNHWHNRSNPIYDHFSTDIQPVGPRVHDWDTEIVDPAPAPWDGLPIVPLPNAIGGINNRISTPTPPAHHLSNLRQLELIELNLRGNMTAAQQGMAYAGAGGYECAWMFGGLVQSFSFGPAWDCFYYVLSDLYITQPSIVSLVSFVQDILNDIIAISAGVIVGTNRVMLHFEGATDVASAAPRLFLACANTAYQIGALSVDPLPVFQDIMMAFQSDAMDDFLFYRLYVHILRFMGGGTLENMPSEFLKLRMSKSYGGRKGYKMIAGGEEKACGLEAVIWGLAGLLTKLQKRLKSLKEAIPDFYKKFDNYRERANTISKKLLKTQIMLELTEMADWRQGRAITHEQLGIAVKSYCEKYDLDIGLIIFDAIIPMKKQYINYDPSEYVPKNMLCLVYWDFKSIGHYDCIDEIYVTSWILRNEEEKKKGKRNTHAKFDFTNLKMNYGRKEEGLRCRLCKWWTKYQTKDLWYKVHDGAQADNKISCIDCGVNFKSIKCYKNHTVLQLGYAESACARNQLCDKCEGVHDIKHNCDNFYCQMCVKSVSKSVKHVCFIQPLSKKKLDLVDRVIYADLESDVNPETKRQRALVCETSYVEPCEDHEIPNIDCKLCKTIEKEFYGYSCLTDFLKWLNEEQMGATVVFHNGGKYDLQLLCEQVAIDDGNLVISLEIPRGTQIVYLELKDKRHFTKKSKSIRFIDSLMFIFVPLGNFDKAFGLKQNKGVFPYGLLNRPGWEEVTEIPGPSDFCITPKEIKFLDKVKLNNKNRGGYIQEILDYISEWKGKEWKAKEKLIEYCKSDVKVLMQGCNIFRYNFRKLVGLDPFKFPTLASAMAASHRQPAYMIADSMQLFDMKSLIWMRSCLVGGRTEPFYLYVDCIPGWRIKFVDIRSEYPFAMATKRYPVGEVTYDVDFGSFISYDRASLDFNRKTDMRLYDVLTNPDGKCGMGMIECEIITANDVNFPVLPCRSAPPGKKESKLLYMVRSGVWKGYITLLATAIKHNQVLVTTIKKIMYWKITSVNLFKDLMCKLYAGKAMAGGWDKILGKDGKDKKEEILKLNADMGIIIDPDKVETNKGLECTAKVMANCVWGYICQRPTATHDTFYDNEDRDEVEKMGNVLESYGTRHVTSRLVGKPVKVGNYTKIRSTKDPADMTVKEMNKNVCYQAGGQVPTYGQQILAEGILSLSEDQPIYCDTDSIVYLIKDDHEHHKELKTGVLLGDWVDEYPDSEIKKFACLGPKSYFMEILHKDGKVEYKGKFKGIPICSRSYSLEDPDGKLAKLGMDEMEAFLQDAVFENHDEKNPYLEMKLRYNNSFSRNSQFQISSREEKKTLRVTFDKRKVVKPAWISGISDCSVIRTVPHNDLSSDYTSANIKNHWKEIGRSRLG